MGLWTYVFSFCSVQNIHSISSKGWCWYPSAEANNLDDLGQVLPPPQSFNLDGRSVLSIWNITRDSDRPAVWLQTQQSSQKKEGVLALGFLATAYPVHNICSLVKMTWREFRESPGIQTLSILFSQE